MPANAIGQGMPRQPSRAAISDREDHGATPQPQPNPSAVLTVRARARLCVVARRGQGQAPPGWPAASLDPGHADNARSPTGPNSHNLHVHPTTSLTRPRSFRDADPRSDSGHRTPRQNGCLPAVDNAHRTAPPCGSTVGCHPPRSTARVHAVEPRRWVSAPRSVRSVSGAARCEITDSGALGSAVDPRQDRRYP